MKNNYDNELVWGNHYRTPYLSAGDCNDIRGLIEEFRVKLNNRYR